MAASFGSGPRRTPKRLVETAPRVASPPHRGVAREEVVVLVDGVPQTLEVVRQERHLGGTQGYWLCPRCSALRSHLYVRDGALACRVCHRLDYRSRHVRNRAVIRAAKLRRRLGGAGLALAVAAAATALASRLCPARR